MKLCKCGCGQPTLRDYDHGVRKGPYNDFIHGHQSRGLPKSPEHRRKLSESRKANPTKYWLGKKIPEYARQAMRGKRKPLSADQKAKLSIIGKKRLSNPIERQKCASWNGKQHTLAQIQKMSDAQKGERGSNWQGGKSTERRLLRASSEFRRWRLAVFTKDKFTCRKCGKSQLLDSDLKLHPHHIKPFKYYPGLRFVVGNGITLCLTCHMKLHNMKKGNFSGEYPSNWRLIAERIKKQSGYCCERCGHIHEPSNGYTLTVHHLDGNKSNCQDWNLAALCQKCHLSIQGKVFLAQFYMLEHSKWFRPHVDGYYKSIQEGPG